MDERDDYRICSACGGDGAIRYREHDGSECGYEYDEECAMCDGSGYESGVEPHPTSATGDE
jgi:DnaJ-class molecular chaperone